MAIDYNLLDFHLNSLVTELMKQKGLTYESALQKVMTSATYRKMQEEPWLLEEGPMYLFDLLEKEETQG